MTQLSLLLPAEPAADARPVATGETGDATGGRIMVDELRHWGPTKLHCFRNGSCHLTTDGDPEELHRFARRLGLRREWFQPDALHPHYDLTPDRRRRALEMGAVFVPSREQAQQRLAGPRTAMAIEGGALCESG
jgi:hypothetical protein